MKRRECDRRRCVFTLFRTFAVAAILLGCASPPPPAPDESQLLAAGFKMLVAKTVQQQEHLRTLAPGKITEWQRNGAHFFVYPDVAKNQLYVGTPKEYAAYRRVRPDEGPTLSQQRATEMASYEKQDAAMQMYTNRDLADPYYFWDSFDGLGWR